MTHEEKIEKIKTLNSELLVEMFAKRAGSFNPVDDEFIWEYEAIRSEIIRRCNSN